MRRLLLALLVASATVLDSTSGQDNLFNYGRQWNVWSESHRGAYMQGFVDGQSSTYLAVLSDLPRERRELLRLKTFTLYAAAELSAVMTSLYADPANTFIRHDAMVHIARDMLNGQDVEPALRRAREKERGFTK